MNSSELSFEICKLYSKGSCKKCNGRGYLIFDIPATPHVLDKNTTAMKQSGRFADYCDCVKKNLRKIK